MKSTKSQFILKSLHNTVLSLSLIETHFHIKYTSKDLFFYHHTPKIGHEKTNSEHGHTFTYPDII